MVDIITEDLLIKQLKDAGAYCFTRKHSNLEELKYGFIYPKLIIVLTGVTHIIRKFFEEMLPNLYAKITLVIVETDYVDLKLKDINNSKIKKIYTWNAPKKHKKIVALPIGLNHDRQFNQISKFLKNDLITFEERNKLLLVNHNPETNLIRPVLYDHAEKFWKFASVVKYMGYGSHTVQDSLIEGQIAINTTPDNYYDMLNQFKFALSPAGAGIDCHRHWECMYLGVIPVLIKQNHPAERAFVNLPVILVDDYKRITANFLMNEVEKIKNNKDIQMERLTLSYWVSRILGT
jgi:hypothetical protein